MPNFSKNQHFLPPDTHGLVIRTFALLPTNRVLICKTSLSWFLNWNLTFAALKIETRYNLLISVQETLNLFIWTFWIAFILNWIKIITLSLMLLLPPKNIVCIRSVKFLSFVIMLYFFKSSIRHCMQYLSCLDRCSFLLLKISRTSYRNGYMGLSSQLLQPLLNLRLFVDMSSRSLFCKYYFSKCSSELSESVPPPCFRERSIRYFDCMILCPHPYVLWGH